MHLKTKEGSVSEFECLNCAFTTDDPSLPECPSCGGYLSEKEEGTVAFDDVRTTEELYY